ncbi:hypothetical protein ID866_8493 [Astraeus odoratus]|nr:hypothetical protein ID866_8493 [Astraeus odoratus]
MPHERVSHTKVLHPFWAATTTPHCFYHGRRASSCTEKCP